MARNNLTPTERRLASQAGAHKSWEFTEDWSARTAPARQAANARFERQVDPDRVLPPAVRAKRAEQARQAHFKRMAFESVKARRRRAAARNGGRNA